MKKYKVIMSTSYAHEIYLDAKNYDAAIEQANSMSQEKIEEQTISKWDVPTFPTIVEIKEDK